jgi:DNA-binding NarL/FixJ family response regulator
MNSPSHVGTLSASSTMDDKVGRARLIIADDHPDMREAVVRLLEPHFEIVATVSDGDAALDAAITLKPDVVILDISMPFLNGIEVARRLMATGSNVKIVFLTVVEDPDFVREAFAAGGSAYVVKSRLTTDLRQAINEALAGHTFISPPFTLN